MDSSGPHAMRARVIPISVFIAQSVERGVCVTGWEGAWGVRRVCSERSLLYKKKDARAGLVIKRGRGRKREWEEERERGRREREERG